eukprot:COSAG03_NODE_9_length_23924_cov_40.675690_4_plen_146_part_00
MVADDVRSIAGTVRIDYRGHDGVLEAAESLQLQAWALEQAFGVYGYDMAKDKNRSLAAAKRNGKYVTFDPKLVIGDEQVPSLLDKNGGFFKAVGRPMHASFSRQPVESHRDATSRSGLCNRTVEASDSAGGVIMHWHAGGGLLWQ